MVVWMTLLHTCRIHAMWRWENILLKEFSNSSLKILQIFCCYQTCMLLLPTGISWECWMADKVKRFWRNSPSHVDWDHSASGCKVYTCTSLALCMPPASMKTLKAPRWNAFFSQCCEIHSKSSHCKVQSWNWVLGGAQFWQWNLARR